MSEKIIDFGILLPPDFLKTADCERYKNGKKPNFDLEEYISPPTSELELWGAVIAQAVHDAVIVATTPKAKGQKNKAILWFSIHNEDFLTVCDLAGVNPATVIRLTRKYMKAKTTINIRKTFLRRVSKRHRGIERVIATESKPIWRSKKFKI